MTLRDVFTGEDASTPARIAGEDALKVLKEFGESERCVACGHRLEAHEFYLHARRKCLAGDCACTEFVPLEGLDWARVRRLRNVHVRFWHSVRRGLSGRKSRVKQHEDRSLHDKVIGWSIYGDNLRWGDYVRRWRFVHRWLKMVFIVPALQLAGKMVDKRLQRTVPRTEYNKNLEVFNDSFEKSVSEWSALFIRNLNDRTRGEGVDYHLSDYARTGSAAVLRDAKNVALTVALSDTAYREFLNIWMFNVALLMKERYKDCKDPKHLFYVNDSINDPTYLIARKVIMDMEGRGPTEGLSIENARG